LDVGQNASDSGIREYQETNPLVVVESQILADVKVAFQAILFHAHGAVCPRKQGDVSSIRHLARVELHREQCSDQ
jgi:hypothetical protein